MNNKNLLNSLQGLTYLAQVGISFATPIILMLLLANWLVSKGLVGAWIYALFIVLGLGAGIASFYSFVKYVMRRANKKEQTQEKTVPDELRGKLQ